MCGIIGIISKKRIEHMTDRIIHRCPDKFGYFYGENFAFEHKRLKSLIAIELKIGKFKPEYAEKMNFYLSVLNNTIKLPDENPFIDIISCKEKKRTTVEYVPKESYQLIGIATYNLTESLPIEFKDLLPSVSEISKKLEDLYENGVIL